MAINLNSKVVIVGGKFAEAMALEYGIYVCQPNRYFRQDTEYIAFYHLKQIKYIFRIIGVEKNVQLSKSQIIKSINYLSAVPLKGSEVNDVYQLKLFDESLIIHDGNVPFVRKQRYTTLDKYLKASDTTML